LLDETSAKEGDVPVAIARPFPFQETSAPRRSAAAADSPLSPEVQEKPQTTLPILARIPDITIGSRRADETGLFDDSTKRIVKYRLDAAHSPVADESTPRQRNTRRALRQRRSSNSSLEQLSATIRFGVKAWEFVQTYPSALRTVAMFLLTAATGTSMMLMMGHHSTPVETSATTQPTPTAASSESTLSSKPAAGTIETETDSSGATTLVPTAIGPRGLVVRPTENMIATPGAESFTSSGAESPVSEPLPRLQVDRGLAARGPSRHAAPPVSYPTTSYSASEPDFSGIDANALPRAQMSEQPQAVARLRGDIEGLSR
jgi:hypothetical protein